MKKSKKLLLTFAIMAAMATAGALGACGGKAPADLVNFGDGVQTVEIGSRYLPDMTSVSDENGNSYPLIIKAYDSGDNEIGVTDGAFQITDMGGYTVKYTAKVGGKEFVRSVAVSVTDTTAPELKILGLRSEREAGTIPYPYVAVTDNSGEKLKYTLDVISSDGQSAPFVKGEESITFSGAGKYKFVASATDSSGNVGKAEKEIVITESMGANVWENFANANHMETVKNTTYLTAMTQSSWLAEWQGREGVAKIQPNYAGYYHNNFFVQLGLPKTKDEIEQTNWDYFEISLYIHVEGLSEVTLGNGDDFVFNSHEIRDGREYTTYSTDQWVTLKVDKKTYLDKSNRYMFPGFLGNEDIGTRSSAFASAVTDAIPRPMFSVSVGDHLNKIDLSDVVIYIDEITWGYDGPDEEGPQVILDGAAWNVLSNTSMTLPNITVSDNKDPVPVYSAKFFQVSQDGDREIAIKANKVAIGEAGTYKLVVTAKDFSNNVTVKEFYFTASDKIDYTKLATYDYENHIGGFSGTLSWLSDFQGESGVMKLSCMGREEIKAIFNKEYLQKANEAKWDYINIRMWVECEDMPNEQYRLYSWLSNLGGDQNQREWVDFKISVNKLAYMSYLSYDSKLTRNDVYNKMISWYADSFSTFFYLTGAVNDISGKVNIYIDEITWGVNPPDTTPPEIKATGVWKTEINAAYTLPVFTATDNGMDVGIASVTLYRDGSTTPIAVNNNQVTFTELGRYKIVVTATDDAGNIATANYYVTVVEQIDEKEIASYDNDYEIGILGLYNNTGSVTYAESHTDQDGTTKTGLMKMTFNGDHNKEIITLNLPKKISDAAKEGKFDYIEIVFCIDTDLGAGNEGYGGFTLYSMIKSIPHYSQKVLACRTWHTLKVSLDDLRDAGSYLSGSHNYTKEEAREAFLNYYTENMGYFFNLSSWFNGREVVMYVDSLSWGVNAPDTTSPTITMSGSLKAALNKEYSLPLFTAADEESDAQITSVILYKEGSDTPVPVTDGKVTLTATGNYYIVVTATDAAGNVATERFDITLVESIDEKAIATYDNASELGVLGLEKNSGSTSYVASFTDKDGTTKTGLMKMTFSGTQGAEVISLNLSKSVSDAMKAANFDYIEITLCVDTDNSYGNIYSLYSRNKSIPEYTVNPLACRKWETVKISLEDLRYAGTYLSDSYNYTVEQARNAFITFYTENAASFFDLSSWFQGKEVVMYVDSIVWGVNSATAATSGGEQSAALSADNAALAESKRYALTKKLFGEISASALPVSGRA